MVIRKCTVNLFLSLFLLSGLWGEEPVGEVSPFLNLNLPEEQWVGLGFWLAPLAHPAEALYPHCFFQDNSLFQIPVDLFSGQLASLEELNGYKARLKLADGRMIWCHKNPVSKVFEELVFYKDLEEARKAYTNLKVWSKTGIVYALNRKQEIREVRISRFTPMLALGAELAPPSAEFSLRVRLELPDGREVFYPISFTGINRNSVSNGLSHHCFLKPPWEMLNFTQEDFERAVRDGVQEGMTQELAELILGTPVHRSGPKGRETLIYRQDGREIRYVMHAGRVMIVSDTQPDEFE